MLSDSRLKQAIGFIAFLIIGLAGAYTFVEANGRYDILIMISGFLILILIVKKYMDLDRLFITLMYLVVMATFLNQSLVSIDIGFFRLFLYRLLLIAAVLTFLFSVLKEKALTIHWNQVKTKSVLLFFLFWMAYGTVSLIWAKSLFEGLKYLLLLGTGVLFVFLAVFTFTTVFRLFLFYGVWMVMTFFLLIIGFVNHFGQIQLPSSTLYGMTNYKASYPTAVFFNQNDFATFLTISFFFYLSVVKNSRKILARTISLLLAMGCIYIIYLTESRASLLGVVAGFITYFFILLPKVLKKASVIIGSLAVIVVIILFFEKIVHGLEEFALYSVYDHGQEKLSSNVIRLNLLKSTFTYLIQSFGMGVGAGNLPFYLEHHPIYETNGIVEVHNWFAEIIGNFGIFVFLGYCLTYGYLFYNLFAALNKQRGRKQKGLIEACLMGLIAFLISSISPSSMSNLYFHWVFLGFVISVVSVFKNMNRYVKEENELRSKF